MKNIIYILIFIFLIFVIQFYMTRKIESFKINVENFDSQCPNLDNIKQYVQQYLPDDNSWDTIVSQTSVNTEERKKQNINYQQCISTDGWTKDCVPGMMNDRSIRAPRQCQKRPELNCEATDECKWYYGFCENKDYNIQIEDPFSFRTRNWWQNRIAGYPNISYNDRRDGFIKFNNGGDSLKKSAMSTNSNVISFYKKIFADLMEVINDPFSTEEVRENATQYLNDLRNKMKTTKNSIMRVQRMSDINRFGHNKVCNKNYTRNCFISKKYTSFVDNMGSIWHKQKSGDFVLWDQVVGGANSTDSTGVCASGGGSGELENNYTDINSGTSSTVIDSILAKKEWEISANISISDKSTKWRNLFHYGNSNITRAPAMWLWPNDTWKLHFRIKTTKGWNDGIDFYVPKQFQIPGKDFNVRIQHKGYNNSSKIIVYINNVLIKEQQIGLFIRVKNQKFDLKQTWGHYTDVDNYTISNFGMR